MEQSKEAFVSFSTAVKALQQRCSEADSGTMYLITDKERGAIFSIARGRIVDASYNSVRGSQALSLMCGIKTTKFFFKNNPNIGNGAAAGNQMPMPANDEIFNLLDSTANNKNHSAPKTNAKAKKILVVEDSAMARKALVKVLEETGYEIVEAADGFEALGKLGEHEVDLVLLDLILPKMDGYAVLTAMKKDEKYANIPVVVLTSRDALFDKLKGKMSGTDEYLTKPIRRSEVINKVKKYLD
jgi:twitching motility two-component system response regulator PilG